MDADKIIASIEDFNKDVSQWVYRVRSILKRNASKATHGKPGTITRKTRDGYSYTEQKLEDTIRSNIHKDFGEVDFIGYRFPRHGIFYAKGVGNGYGINGKVIKGLVSNKVKTIGKSRTPQDWFNSTLDKQVPMLADIVADHKADEAVVNAAGMKIH